MQRKLCNSRPRDSESTSYSRKFASIRGSKFAPAFHASLVTDGKIALTGQLQACSPTRCDHRRRIDAKSGKSR